MSNPFRYFNSSPEIIRLAVLMYVKYPLSLGEGLRSTRASPSPRLQVLGCDPFQHVRHRRRFPFPPARRGDAAPIESGGDLPKRLRASGPNLGNEGRDASGMRVRLGLMGGVGDGAGLGPPEVTASPEEPARGAILL